MSDVHRPVQLTLLSDDLATGADLVGLIAKASSRLGQPLDWSTIDTFRAHHLAGELLAALGLPVSDYQPDWRP